MSGDQICYRRDGSCSARAHGELGLRPATIVFGIVSHGLQLSCDLPELYVTLKVTNLRLYNSTFLIGIGRVFHLLMTEIHPSGIQHQATAVAPIKTWGADLAVSPVLPQLPEQLARAATMSALAGISNRVLAVGLLPEAERPADAIRRGWQAGGRMNALRYRGAAAGDQQVRLSFPIIEADQRSPP